MPPPSTLKQAGVVFAKLLLANIATTVTLALSFDSEIVLVAPVCSAIAAPSLLLYAMLDVFRRPHSYLPEIALLGSLIPFATYMAWCAFVGPEGKELATIMLALYVLATLVALSAQILLRSDA
jgi:hypothetical protein